ncbi:hypothetical protein NM208_g2313 [Fusarium decemcellulare]|uniref:Uncharacterized protein n=1 Tax=Fusarium decemcellulare TaxID=57161 RepID=A0ACC1ST31_9HYPO|nr:hypothetical protein NM208_g2313 [Fusarium decemcellulare]
MLVAACSPAQIDLDWAAENLVPHGVSVYATFEDMLKHTWLEAVIIASATPLHQPQTIECIKHGIHVLCEKPIAPNSQQIKELLDASTSYPKVKVMPGFSRRFDQNYIDAKSKVQSGTIGDPIVIRAQACDSLDTGPPYKEYLKQSGGIFLDATIHDIDLALCFFGEDVKPKAVWAAGVRAFHKDLITEKDADNAVGICEFQDDRIAFFYNSRTSPRGFDNSTEIFGTQGKIAVNLLSRHNRVEVIDKDGVSMAPMQSWLDRYSESFVHEVNTFVDTIINDRPVPITLEEALKGCQIAEALQRSLQTGERILFDEAK